ncbi:MAG: hypothetical protein RIS35_1320 [Pseudomonadota bacterium]|jgi:transposase
MVIILQTDMSTQTQTKRRWSAAEKLAIVEESRSGGMSVATVAMIHGVHPNQLSSWRKEVREGRLDASAVVAGNVELESARRRIRHLERLLGAKTLEVEMLRDALGASDWARRQPKASPSLPGSPPRR